MKHSSVFSFACVFATAALGLAAAESVVFSENFEAPAWQAGRELLADTALPNGWSGNHDGTTLVSKISGPVGGGTQSLYLQDGDASAVPDAVRDFGRNLSKGHIQFDWYRPASATDNLYVYCMDSGVPWTPNFVLSLSPTGIAITRMRGAPDKTVTFASLGVRESLGKWHSVRMTFDNAAGTLDVALNGKSVAELAVTRADSGAYAVIPWRVGRIRFVAGYGASAASSVAGHFDNIEVVETDK